MIPAAWLTPVWSYLWQVALHSSVMGLVFYAWAHRIGLPSGRTKRHLLMALLVLPLLTAAVPGRAGLDFAERVAWLNSARLLAVPLPAGFTLLDAVVFAAALVTLLTIWQEVAPAIRTPPTTPTGVPEWMVRDVRARPGWENCAVAVSPLASVFFATSGRPGRPRLIVSKGALQSLGGAELAVVIAHEHAHWRGGEWIRSLALFVIRMLQCYHPVALWVFREYCVEQEIACDAAAVAGRDPHVLARVLLRIYLATGRREIAARASLRKRIDLLMSGGPNDNALPTATVAVASAVMVLVLPWIV